MFNKLYLKYFNIEFSINFQKLTKSMKGSNEAAKARTSLTTQDSFGYNSLKNTENSKQAQPILVCRICLQESHNNDESETFVKPCRCSGSLEYVHQACLIQWLNTMVKMRVQLGQPLQKIHCQICQEELDIEFKKRLVCRNKQSLKKRIQVYWPHLLVSIVFIVLTLGGMGALAYFQQTAMNVETQQDKITLKIVFIIAWVLLSLSFIVWVVKIIKNFLIKKETYIGNVQSKPVALSVRNQNNAFQQSYAESQPEPQNPSIDVSNAESTLVRRKVKVIPLKPAFRNESADRLGDQLSENPNPWREVKL